MKVKYSLFLGVVVLCACLGLSFVSAADSANDAQVVCDTSSLDAEINKTNDVEIDTNISYDPSKIFIKKSSGLMVPPIKDPTITLNNTSLIIYHNISYNEISYNESRYPSYTVKESSRFILPGVKVDTITITNPSNNVSYNYSSIFINESYENNALSLLDIKVDTLTIKNNYWMISLRNITCDVLTIEDSKPYFIDIYDSNIKQVIFRNVDTWSLVDVSSVIQNSNIDSLIINKSSIDFSLKIISSNIGNMTLDNSYIKYLLFKYSNVSIQNVVESTIKSIEVCLHSNLIIEDGQNSSYNLCRDKTSRVNAIGGIGSLRPVGDDSERRTRYHMVGTGVWVPTFIQVDFHQYINCAEETCKPNGSTVHMSACVKTYAFLFIYSDPIGHGTLSLLKDGEVIDVKKLSENSNPTFTFKIEKGHTYALKYEGTCFQESSWYYRHYEDSSKTLKIDYRED